MDILHNQLKPENGCGQSLVDKVNSEEKFRYVQQQSMDLLQTLDERPFETVKVSEEKVKLRRRAEKRQSKLAVVAQSRMDMLLRQLRQYFTSAAIFRRKDNDEVTSVARAAVTASARLEQQHIIAGTAMQAISRAAAP